MIERVSGLDWLNPKGVHSFFFPLVYMLMDYVMHSDVNVTNDQQDCYPNTKKKYL